MKCTLNFIDSEMPIRMCRHCTFYIECLKQSDLVESQNELRNRLDLSSAKYSCLLETIRIRTSNRFILYSEPLRLIETIGLLTSTTVIVA
jgi:hypothetical protein